MVYTGTVPNCVPHFLYCTKQGFELSQTARNSLRSNSLACLDNSKIIVLAILRKLHDVWFSTCISHYCCYYQTVNIIIIIFTELFSQVIYTSAGKTLRRFCHFAEIWVIELSKVRDCLSVASFEHFVIIHKHISCKIKIGEQF